MGGAKKKPQPVESAADKLKKSQKDAVAHKCVICTQAGPPLFLVPLFVPNAFPAGAPHGEYHAHQRRARSSCATRLSIQLVPPYVARVAVVPPPHRNMLNKFQRRLIFWQKRPDRRP
jgi:hypothetical protein